MSKRVISLESDWKKEKMENSKDVITEGADPNGNGKRKKRFLVELIRKRRPPPVMPQQAEEPQVSYNADSAQYHFLERCTLNICARSAMDDASSMHRLCFALTGGDFGFLQENAGEGTGT